MLKSLECNEKMHTFAPALIPRAVVQKAKKDDL